MGDEPMVKKESALSDFIREIEAVKKADEYKVYEKYAPYLGWDIRDQNAVTYWKLMGESELHYGQVTIYETKETLRNRKFGSSEYMKFRPKYMKQILNEKEKKAIAAKFPKKCPDCGFRRFFGIRICETSIVRIFEIICPSCDKELKTIYG